MNLISFGVDEQIEDLNNCEKLIKSLEAVIATRDSSFNLSNNVRLYVKEFNNASVLDGNRYYIVFKTYTFSDLLTICKLLDSTGRFETTILPTTDNFVKESETLGTVNKDFWFLHKDSEILVVVRSEYKCDVFNLVKAHLGRGN